MRDIGAIVKYLKKTPSGSKAVSAIKDRTAMVAIDPMAQRVMAYVPKPMPEGKFLDVGCYGGWLYEKLGRPANYIGIDAWPEAIEAAKETYPEGDFRLCNVFAFEEKADYVFCSQVIWGENAKVGLKKVKEIGAHGIVLMTRTEADATGALFEPVDSLAVHRW